MVIDEYVTMTRDNSGKTIFQSPFGWVAVNVMEDPPVVVTLRGGLNFRCKSRKLSRNMKRWLNE